MLHAPRWEKHIIALCAGQLNAAAKTEAVLSPARGTHLDTAYFSDMSKEEIISVILPSMPGVFRNECNPTLPTSSVGLLQVYTDKKATTLQASAMVPYPIPIVLLDLTRACRRLFLNEGYKVLGFVPV